MKNAAIVVLAALVVAMAGGWSYDHSRLANENGSLKLAKGSLIDELNEADAKFASADFQRQSAEEGEARWKRAVTALYPPAIFRRLHPVPLPDGTGKVVWPNPYDLPALVAEHCSVKG